MRIKRQYQKLLKYIESKEVYPFKEPGETEIVRKPNLTAETIAQWDESSFQERSRLILSTASQLN